MDEIVFSETRHGVMEPKRGRLTKLVRFLNNNIDVIERYCDLVMAAALWGLAAWGFHKILERLAAAMGAA